MEKNKVMESRGYHNFNRIGRPDVLRDQRTNYKIGIHLYEEYIETKKNIQPETYLSISDEIEETEHSLSN